MPEFYFDYDKRQHFSIPQFNRSRHRYRGPRESEKINLEIEQLYFSVKKLYESQKQVREDFVDYAYILLEGDTLAVLDENTDPIILEGLDDISRRLHELKKRVEALEGQ